MKCSNCGTEFDEGNFCPECGTRVDGNNSNESKNTTAGRGFNFRIIAVIVLLLIIFKIISANVFLGSGSDDLSKYYGKSISQFEKETGVEIEKDGNTYYTGTIFLDTDNNDKIISMSMVFNNSLEGENEFEGITEKDTMQEAAKKLEAAGYKLEEDSDPSIYKNKKGMVVSLSSISEEEYILRLMSEEIYEDQQEEYADDVPEEYYVTDTAWGDTLQTHVLFAYTQNSWGSNIVHVECEITNLSDESIVFDPSDYYRLDNNGISIDCNLTDYSYKEISSAYKFQTTLSFTCPENSNTDLSLMTMTADNLEFNLGDKPQNEEEKKEFYGTYNRTNNKIIVLDNGDGTYTVQRVVKIGDDVYTDKYTDVTLDENNMFYLGGAYIWSPDEYTIYAYDLTWEEIDNDQTPWVKD